MANKLFESPDGFKEAGRRNPNQPLDETGQKLRDLRASGETLRRGNEIVVPTRIPERCLSKVKPQFAKLQTLAAAYLAHMARIEAECDVDKAAEILRARQQAVIKDGSIPVADASMSVNDVKSEIQLHTSSLWFEWVNTHMRAYLPLARDTFIALEKALEAEITGQLAEDEERAEEYGVKTGTPSLWVLAAQNLRTQIHNALEETKEMLAKIDINPSTQGPTWLFQFVPNLAALKAIGAVK